MFNRKEIKSRGKELLKGNLLFFLVVALACLASSFYLVVGIVVVCFVEYFVAMRNLKIYKGSSQTPWFNFDGESFSTYLVAFMIVAGVAGGTLFIFSIVALITILFSALSGSLVGMFILLIMYIALLVGVTILSTMFLFAPYIAIEYPRVGAWKSLTYSYKITKGNLWSIFVYGLSFILWGLLIVITFGIAYFYYLGYMSMSTVCLYKDLSAKSTDFTQSISKYGYTI